MINLVNIFLHTGYCLKHIKDSNLISKLKCVYVIIKNGSKDFNHTQKFLWMTITILLKKSTKTAMAADQTDRSAD